jgi:hypothetical protein
MMDDQLLVPDTDLNLTNLDMQGLIVPGFEKITPIVRNR